MNPNFIISPKTLTLITDIQLYSHIVVNPPLNFVVFPLITTIKNCITHYNGIIIATNFNINFLN